MGVTVHAIKDIEKIKDVEDYLNKKDIRYGMMWKLGINVGIRISDILKLKVKDYQDHSFTIIEQKTHKQKTFNVPKWFQPELEEYIARHKYRTDYLFPNKKSRKPISRTQAWRVIKEAARYCDIDGIGTHSMRKTFGYWYYQKTFDIAALMKLFNHSNANITLLYIEALDVKLKESISTFDVFK